jgi:transmembrane sensor
MEPNHLAWKTGVLEFNDTPLNEVLDQLSEHYQLDFQCEHPSPEQLKLTATFDNEPIESVIESIGLIFGFEECETDSVVRLK